MEQPERAGRPAPDADHPSGRGADRSSCRPAGGGSTAVQDPPRRPRWRERITVTLDLIRANPTGRIALKIFIAIAGALVVTIGIALIPLPGPGWLLVIAGLGIWAVEYHWARRLLGFTRRHVHGWTQLGDATVTGGANRARLRRPRSSWAPWSGCPSSTASASTWWPRRCTTSRRTDPGFPVRFHDRVESVALRAISSVGERFVHTEEVAGSIPASPTLSLCRSEARCRRSSVTGFAVCAAYIGSRLGAAALGG